MKKFENFCLIKLQKSKSPCVLPHTKVCGLRWTFGCSEKSEVALQLLHPKGCSLISLTCKFLIVFGNSHFRHSRRI